MWFYLFNIISPGCWDMTTVSLSWGQPMALPLPRTSLSTLKYPARAMRWACWIVLSSNWESLLILMLQTNPPFCPLYSGSETTISKKWQYHHIRHFLHSPLFALRYLQFFNIFRVSRGCSRGNVAGVTCFSSGELWPGQEIGNLELIYLLQSQIVSSTHHTYWRDPKKKCHIIFPSLKEFIWHVSWNP